MRGESNRILIDLFETMNQGLMYSDAHLIPPTKIRFGISVPYFGANCASSCPFGVCVTAIMTYFWIMFLCLLMVSFLSSSDDESDYYCFMSTLN